MFKLIEKIVKRQGRGQNEVKISGLPEVLTEAVEKDGKTEQVEKDVPGGFDPEVPTAEIVAACFSTDEVFRIFIRKYYDRFAASLVETVSAVTGVFADFYREHPEFVNARILTNKKGQTITDTNEIKLAYAAFERAISKGADEMGMEVSDALALALRKYEKSLTK